MRTVSRRWFQVSVGVVAVAWLGGACKSGDTVTVQDIFVSQGASNGTGVEESPYGTITAALDAVAAERGDGSTKEYVIHVGAGTYSEQVELKPGVHDGVTIRGSTSWDFDEAGRLDKVSGNETRIAFETLADDPAKTDPATDGKGHVVWIHANNVTFEDVVVEALAFSPPPAPTAAMDIDRARGLVVRRVWALGGFVRINVRASEVEFDRALITVGDSNPTVGLSVGGGPEADGLQGKYTLSLCRSQELGNNFQLVAHGNTFDPERVTFEGRETNDVTMTGCLAEGGGRGIAITANLPNDREEAYLSDSENEASMSVHVKDSTLSNNQVGVRIIPDNFGFTNPGEPDIAADTTIEVALAGTTIEGSTDIAAEADGASGDYLTAKVTDSEGVAASILEEGGHPGWVTGSALYYNDEQVGP